MTSKVECNILQVCGNLGDVRLPAYLDVIRCSQGSGDCTRAPGIPEPEDEYWFLEGE